MLHSMKRDNVHLYRIPGENGTRVKSKNNHGLRRWREKIWQPNKTANTQNNNNKKVSCSQR